MGGNYSLPFLLFVLLSSRASNVAAATYDVVSFGAIADLSVDSATAFVSAWSAACISLIPATVYVPKGEFLISQAFFTGPCLCPWIKFSIEGTLVAPSTYYSFRTQWITFNQVNGLSITGGIFDGRGQRLWDCKLGGGRSCPDGASSITFNNANHVFIDGLRSLNSQFFHIVFLRCFDVYVQGVFIEAPDDSPNTDGIHVQRSSNIRIFDANIMTGDDCISIGPNSLDLLIERASCGPGHGISIGSLGQENQFKHEAVKHILVKNSTLTGTQNGVRIKTWGTEVQGIVTNVTFQDILISDVQNPIIIDQNYCPYRTGCPTLESHIKLHDIKYNNIRGISKTQETVYFDCSPSKPCTGLKLQDIKLEYQNQQERSYCRFASGKASGIMIPQSCLSEEI